MPIRAQEKLLAALEKINGQRIAVIGDLMLDRYIWGHVSRISPEAPVPIVEASSESESLGGAANVSNNIHSLGAVTLPIGIVGTDRAGESLLQLVQDSGLSTDGILRLPERPTTVKTRVIAHNQHVVRVDREVRDDISETAVRRILEYLQQIAGGLDAIVIEDYNKGLLSLPLIRGTLEIAADHEIPVTVDPKITNFAAYTGVAVFKPNRKEAEATLAMPVRTPEQLHEAAKALQARISCKNVLITLGEQGLFLREESGVEHMIPTQARKVHDVSGAGDTVIGTLTAAIAAGVEIFEAALLANFAAGVVVGEIGAVPIKRPALISAIRRSMQEQESA